MGEIWVLSIICGWDFLHDEVFVVAICKVQGYGSSWVLTVVREVYQDSRRPTVRISY